MISSRRLLLPHASRTNGLAVATATGRRSLMTAVAATGRMQDYYSSSSSSSFPPLTSLPSSHTSLLPGSRTTTIRATPLLLQRRLLVSQNTICQHHHHHHSHSWTSRHLATTTTTSSSTEPPKKEDEDTHNNDNNNKPTGEEEEETSGDSLRDTVNRLKKQQQQQKGVDGSNNRKNDGDDDDKNNADVLRKAADLWDSFTKEVSLAWQDLIKAGERKDINKKIKRPEATAEGETAYTGPVEIMVIDESEHLTAWERMQRRLTEAPIIQDMLSRTEEVYVKSGAKDAKQKIDHLREDAREAWETSQNPWVYRASSVYDTLTAETPESIAVKELRVLDPDFTLDGWREDVVGHTLPQIMEWFLQGKINQLKPWLGEGVFKRIAAEITARAREGVQIDTHVLGIMNSEILAVEPDEVNKGSPIILLHFMCQQINCVRKKETGEIVEGSEDDIRANSYVCAFQREYNEEEGELNWVIVDFRFNGAIAYL